jgi:hypothetical protein
MAGGRGKYPGSRKENRFIERKIIVKIFCRTEKDTFFPAAIFKLYKQYLTR